MQFHEIDGLFITENEENGNAWIVNRSNDERHWNGVTLQPGETWAMVQVNGYYDASNVTRSSRSSRAEQSPYKRQAVGSTPTERTKIPPVDPKPKRMIKL